MLKPYGEFTDSQGKKGWEEMWAQIPHLHKEWKGGPKTSKYLNFEAATTKDKLNLIQKFIEKQWKAGNIDEIGPFKNKRNYRPQQFE